MLTEKLGILTITTDEITNEQLGCLQMSRQIACSARESGHIPHNYVSYILNSLLMYILQGSILSCEQP